MLRSNTPKTCFITPHALKELLLTPKQYRPFTVLPALMNEYRVVSVLYPPHSQAPKRANADLENLKPELNGRILLTLKFFGIKPANVSVQNGVLKSLSFLFECEPLFRFLSLLISRSTRFTKSPFKAIVRTVLLEHSTTPASGNEPLLTSARYRRTSQGLHFRRDLSTRR